jgi:hypothetical protein
MTIMPSLSAWRRNRLAVERVMPAIAAMSAWVSAMMPPDAASNIDASRAMQR